MSEATVPTTPTTPMTAEAELALAFTSQEPSPQEIRGDTQETSTPGVENPADPSRVEPGTTDPSRTEPAPSREQLLASLTLEELTAHPTLGKQLQSWKDTEAAKQAQGLRARVEADTRAAMAFEQAKQDFAAMTPDELGQAIQDPQVAAMYARVKNPPSPPPDLTPAISAQVQYYQNVIHSTGERLATLPTEKQAELDPHKHLLGVEGVDPSVTLAKWVDRVNEAAVAHQVAVLTGRASASQALEADADADASKPAGPLMTNGINTAPLPDIMTGNSGSILEDAFRRTARASR